MIGIGGVIEFMRTHRSVVLIILLVVAVALSFFPAATYGGNNKPLRFEVTMMAEIKDSKAADAGFSTGGDECTLAVTSFKVSNGERASMASAYFATADEANRYLEWFLKSYESVKERGQFRYHGKPIGRRAVALARTGIWDVMWTDGSTFRRFSSSALPTALELEKQNMHPDFWNKTLSPR
jgi:hypothetical protein